MSDGIVVLVTETPPELKEESPVEYRVAYVPDVNDLYGPFDDASGQYQTNVDVVLDHFTEVTIWTNVDLALEEADRIYYRLGKETSHGIVFFNQLKSKVYTDL